MTDARFPPKPSEVADLWEALERADSARQRAETQLAEREALLSLFVDHAPAAIAMFDRDMRYLAVSRRFLEDYRLDPDRNAVGQSHYEIFPEIPDHWRAIHKRVLSGEEHSHPEDAFRRKDGRLDWVRWSMKPWRLADGAIGGALLFSEVITKEVEARQRLRESEEHLSIAVEAAKLGIWRWDLIDGFRALQWDSRCKALFGLPSDAEVTFESWESAIQAEDRDRVKAEVARALDPADPRDDYACEYRAARPDGTVLWLHSTGRAFFEEAPACPSGRRAVSMTGALGDVTQAHIAKDALKENRARLRAALRAGKLGVYDYDPRTGVVQWDARMYGLWGAPEGEPVTYETFEAGVHPDDLSAVREAVANGLDPAGSRHYECEYRVVNRSDGNVRSVLADGDVTFDAAGEPSRIVGIVQDITERKTAEKLLRETNEGRLRAVVDTAVDAIVVIDDRGFIESANPAAEGIFGFKADEMVGRNVSMLMPQLEAVTHDNCISKFLQTGHAKIIGVGREVMGRRKDGSLFPLELAVAEWRAGDKSYFTGIMRDITLRKKREKQIETLLREVNHRSKNMLAVVVAIGRQTLATKPDDFARSFEERILALSANQDLLVKSGWTGVYLDELVRSQLAPFKDSIGGRIKFAGPSVFLSADAAQAIGMALHELATNAGKYGALSDAKGCVTITWSLEPSPPEGETFVMTWVEEGGPPVSEPKRRGFGSTVIGRLVEQSLDAEVEFANLVTGVCWRMACSAQSVLEGKRAKQPRQ